MGFFRVLFVVLLLCLLVLCSIVREEGAGRFAFRWHYENMPIQIYRKFHFQKLKIFR